MSKDSAFFVGLDTHKTSIAVAYIGSEREDTVQDYGTRRAQLRLCKRYRDLTHRYKNKNIVVVAIARELAAFMWEIVTKGLPQATSPRAH